MYFEDQDLCYQHSISGKKCISFNNLNLTHYIGKSNKTSNYNMELIKVKSMLYYANKNIKNGFILKTILFIISLPLSIFNPRIRYILKNYNSYE